MKQVIIFTLLFLCFSISYAQYTVSNNGVIYDENGQHVKVEDFKNILSGNPGMIKLYEAGRNKKDFGNAMMIGGLALVAGGLASPMLGEVKPGESSSITMPLIGGGFFVVGGLIKIGFRKKIKQSVEAFNDLKSNAMNIETTYEIVSNSSGLGIRINF